MSCQVNCNHTIHIAGAIKLQYNQAFKKDTITDRRDRKINEILGI